MGLNSKLVFLMVGVMMSSTAIAQGCPSNWGGANNDPVGYYAKVAKQLGGALAHCQNGQCTAYGVKNASNYRTTHNEQYGYVLAVTTKSNLNKVGKSGYSLAELRDEVIPMINNCWSRDRE